MEVIMMNDNIAYIISGLLVLTFACVIYAFGMKDSYGYYNKFIVDCSDNPRHIINYEKDFQILIGDEGDVGILHDGRNNNFYIIAVEKNSGELCRVMTMNDFSINIEFFQRMIEIMNERKEQNND